MSHYKGIMPREEWERTKKINLIKKRQKEGCAFYGRNCKGRLEFHHVDKKRFNIGHGLMRYSFRELKREINNCVVLCHDCHNWVHTEGVGALT